MKANNMIRKKVNISQYGIQMFSCIIFVLLLFGLFGSRAFGKENKKKDYGVFLSLDASDIKKIAGYRTVVIDAQYFSKKDIAYLKQQGCTVYSYLNIGSLEKFRKYYDTYSNLALGDYEHWEEEQWMDVSQAEWQKFLTLLEEEVLDKKIDGFFVDNCDVYYEYHTDDIFTGLTRILKHLMKYEKEVIVNGGDTYVMEYKKRYGALTDIMTGVNQESVWSKINFDTGKFSAQTKSDRIYFQTYVETCDGQGLDVYLLEYTKSKKLMSKIKKYCRKKQFHYYISDSMELE